MIKLIIGILLISSQAQAHEAKEKIKPLESVKLSTSQGDVHVVLHMGGHIYFRPFVLDVYPACSQRTDTNWKQLEIRDTGSLCKVKKNSIKYNAEKNVIQVTGFDVNEADMNRQSLSDPAKIKPKCNVPKTLEFHLENICSQ